MHSLKWIGQHIFRISLKKFLIILIIFGTLVSWLLSNSFNNFHSDPIPYSYLADPIQVSFKCNCQNDFANHASNASLKVNFVQSSPLAHVRNDSDYSIVVAVDINRSKGTKLIVETLEYLRLKYKTIPINKLMQMLAGSNKLKYTLIVIENQQSFNALIEFDQKFIIQYCNQFKVPMISFFASKNATNFEHLSTSYLRFPENKVQSIYISNHTDLLKIIKRNVTIGCGTKSGSDYHLVPDNYSWNVFKWNNNESYIPLVEVVYHTSGPLPMPQKSAAIVFHPGNDSYPAQCLFANRFQIWINRLAFMECVGHFLSIPHPVFSLERFFLIDIDDIFVGTKGIRLRVDDVFNMIKFQSRMSRMVTKFKLNLGFSGKFFNKGFDEEDAGDQLLIQHSDRFWWFCHTYAHSQPHLFANQSLLEDQLRLNQKFAQKHGINANQGYAVAPHHSGVYPVHGPLYNAWKNIWSINVTSTEEYPHLRPARSRKGFIFNGIRVLPRQTCGLYTHTIRLNQYPGGKDRLFRSIYGGELFFQFIFNPISIFMTHMSNYATDRLAPYAFETVIKILKCYTNLRFQSQTPDQLAHRYFQMYPDQQMPLWTNPCRDRRHLDIWANQQRCHSFPSFVIVGPQRSGSTALHSFLRIHPSVQPNMASKDNFEELQFFNSRNYQRGVDWYLRHFPAPKSERDVLFEKSANYFDNELSPKRIHTLMPDVRILIILADPVRRAYSWYQHMRLNQDPIALKYSFLDVLSANSSSMSKLRNLKSRCIKPGFYAQHLERWLSYFPVQQIILIDGQRLASNPVSVMANLQHRLQLKPSIDYRSRLKFSRSKGFFCVTNGLTKKRLNCLGKSKGRAYEPMDQRSRDLLLKIYSTHNQALLKLLGKIGQPSPEWLPQTSLRPEAFGSLEKNT